MVSDAVRLCFCGAGYVCCVSFLCPCFSLCSQKEVLILMRLPAWTSRAISLPSSGFLFSLIERILPHTFSLFLLLFSSLSSLASRPSRASLSRSRFSFCIYVSKRFSRPCFLLLTNVFPLSRLSKPALMWGTNKHGWTHPAVKNIKQQYKTMKV